MTARVAEAPKGDKGATEAVRKLAAEPKRNLELEREEALGFDVDQPENDGTDAAAVQRHWRAKLKALPEGEQTTWREVAGLFPPEKDEVALARQELEASLEGDAEFLRWRHERELADAKEELREAYGQRWHKHPDALWRLQRLQRTHQEREKHEREGAERLLRLDPDARGAAVLKRTGTIAQIRWKELWKTLKPKRALLKRCQAPAKGNTAEICGRQFVAQKVTALYCPTDEHGNPSNACKQRADYYRRKAARET